MSYVFLDDVTLADVAFEARASSLEELFEQSALALTNSMVDDLSKIEQKVEISVNLTSQTIEMLLYNFLQELIFIKDTKKLLFSNFMIKITKRDDEYELVARLRGEEINQDKHKCRVDVKAVTMHRFEVKKEIDKWLARVILDV